LKNIYLRHQVPLYWGEHQQEPPGNIVTTGYSEISQKTFKRR
jgi:hypothetical protein